MLDKETLGQILMFVSKRWTDIAKDPENRVYQSLPSKFWMNSIGGKVGKGRWITTIMYTEDEEEANAIKDVLLRWQSKHSNENNTQGKDKASPSGEGPDLIQISKKRPSSSKSSSPTQSKIPNSDSSQKEEVNEKS